MLASSEIRRPRRALPVVLGVSCSLLSLLLTAPLPGHSGGEVESNRASGAITIDGNLDEWEAALDANSPLNDIVADPQDWYRILPRDQMPGTGNTNTGGLRVSRGSFTGDADLSVRWATVWDDDYLYFAFDVTDDSVNPYVGAATARGGNIDGIWLIFDTKHDAPLVDFPEGTFNTFQVAGSSQLQADDEFWIFAPLTQGGEAIGWVRDAGDPVFSDPANGHAAGQMTDQGYTAEIRMPWSVFERLFGGPLVPEDGQIIGFDITVMDIDGTPPTYAEGEGGAMAWSSDFENDNSPGVLGNLIIRDAPLERVTEGLVTLYEFAEGGGTTVGDTGPGDPLNLEIAQADLDSGLVEWVEGAGLAMNLGTGNGQDGGALVRSAGAAAKVYEAIAGGGGTNALTLEAWVTPELDDLMVNISRMFTMSGDTGNRNFTLGTTADGLNYVNRLRTPITGVNGTAGPNQLIGGEVHAGQRQHVVFTRAVDGTETLYVDGEVTGGPRVVAGNLSDNWDPAYALGIGNEMTRDRKFNGTFHLAAIYDRALSEEEVLQNYASGGGIVTPVGPSQLAGDCNQDGALNMSDVMCMVKLAYPGFLLLDRSPQVPPCETDEGTAAVLDLSGDSRVDGADIVLLADALFGGGSLPGECFGVDEALGCAQNSGCP